MKLAVQIMLANDFQSQTTVDDDQVVPDLDVIAVVLQLDSRSGFVHYRVVDQFGVSVAAEPGALRGQSLGWLRVGSCLPTPGMPPRCVYAATAESVSVAEGSVRTLFASRTVAPARLPDGRC